MVREGLTEHELLSRPDEFGTVSPPGGREKSTKLRKQQMEQTGQSSAKS
jgi:hypothetical protein